MIDWDVAISTGTRSARPGPQVSLAEARRTVSELRDLAGAVQQPVYEVTGMWAAAITRWAGSRWWTGRGGSGRT